MSIMYCNTVIRQFFREETGSLSWHCIPSLTGDRKEKSSLAPNTNPAKMKHRTFEWECATENRIPALAILLMSCAMECIMIIIYVIQPYVDQKEKFFPGYIYLYVFMALFSVCMAGLLNRFKDSPKKLLNIECGVLAVMSVWSAVFSAFDVQHGYSSYLYVQVMIINSLIIKIDPLKHTLINTLGFLIYAAVVLFESLRGTALFVAIVNPFFMLIAACTVVVLNYRVKYKGYLDRQLIKEQHEQLEYYANYDFLTKIPSRKSIIDYLNGFVKEKHDAIACMMIDIDNFKLYNDTYGHISGDNCLIQLAQAMANYIGSQGGRIGRYGGEEFLAVFSGKTQNNVLEIADTLRSIVEEENILFKSNIGSSVTTVSVGVYYQTQTVNSDPVSLLQYADKALYKAKTEGKNRSVLYDEQTLFFKK